MPSYEIRLHDSVVNTGVDGEFFPTCREAAQAAELINSEYPKADVEVCESDEEPTITYAEWHAEPWG